MTRIFSLLALFSALTLLLTACPSSSGTTTPTPTPDFTIAVNNAAPTLVEGATANVTVTITSTGGFADQVELTINNPADVTASFNPASTNSNSVLTLGSAKAGSYPMTLTATAGSITKTAGVTLTVTAGTTQPPTPPTPTTSTIAGFVIDENNQVVANAPVVILGENQSTEALATQALTGVTDANGQFSIAGVKKPYDIAVIVGSAKAAIVYKNLSKDNPTLIFLGSSFTAKRTATVNGTVSGGANYPLPTNHIDRAVFGSPETRNNNTTIQINDTSGDFDTTVEWFGPTTTTGAIHALQWEGSNAFPTKFTGYGKVATTLADNNTANNQDIALTGLGSLNAGGTVTVPTNYSIDGKNLAVTFDANTGLEIGTDSSTNPNFNFVTPQINGAKLSMMVQTSGPNGVFSQVIKTGFDVDSTNISLNVPTASNLSLPVNNANNVNNTTEFVWSPSSANDVVYLTFFGGKSGGPSFLVISDTTKVTIPDLSGQGLGLTASTPGAIQEYVWNVLTVGSYTDIDAAASPGLLTKFFGSIVEDSILAESNLFDFTAVKP